MEKTRKEYNNGMVLEVTQFDAECSRKEMCEYHEKTGGMFLSPDRLIIHSKHLGIFMSDMYIVIDEVGQLFKCEEIQDFYMGEQITSREFEIFFTNPPVQSFQQLVFEKTECNYFEIINYISESLQNGFNPKPQLEYRFDKYKFEFVKVDKDLYRYDDNELLYRYIDGSGKITHQHFGNKNTFYVYYNAHNDVVLIPPVN